MTAVRREITTAAMECHIEKRDAIAAALRSTYCQHERAELIRQHAEAARCVTIFESELAKA
jgi:hypothetical protein